MQSFYFSTYCVFTKCFHWSNNCSSPSSSFKFHILRLVGSTLTLWPVPSSDPVLHTSVWCDPVYWQQGKGSVRRKQFCRGKKTAEQQFPPEAARNERGCSMATFLAGRRRHHIARPCILQQPSLSPQPIHHTQNASHQPGSSPAGRRKIDLFVFGGKGSARGASGSQKKRKRQRWESGRADTEVCVFAFVCITESHQQSVRQADRHPRCVSVCLFACDRDMPADDGFNPPLQPSLSCLSLCRLPVPPGIFNLLSLHYVNRIVAVEVFCLFHLKLFKGQ